MTSETLPSPTLARQLGAEAADQRRRERAWRKFYRDCADLIPTRGEAPPHVAYEAES